MFSIALDKPPGFRVYRYILSRRRGARVYALRVAECKQMCVDDIAVSVVFIKMTVRTKMAISIFIEMPYLHLNTRIVINRIVH